VAGCDASGAGGDFAWLRARVVALPAAVAASLAHARQRGRPGRRLSEPTAPLDATAIQEQSAALIKV
jgi:hypothetical protein